MVIFITSSRCRYCDAMKDRSWRDPEVETSVNQNFVAIELNPHDNAEVLSRIKVPMYPMTLIGIPEGRIIEKRTGYQPVSEVRSLLRAGLQRRLQRR